MRVFTEMTGMCISQWMERMLLKPKCHSDTSLRVGTQMEQKPKVWTLCSELDCSAAGKAIFPILHHPRPQTSAFRLQIRYILAMGEASRPSVTVWGCITAWFCSQPSSYVIRGLLT